MTLSVEYSFMFTDTGVLLNGDDEIFPFVDINRVEGLDTPDYRETFRDHEGVDGGYLDAELQKGRDIVLEGVIYCNIGQEEAFLDTLKSNFAPSRVPLPFYIKIPNVAERVVFAKPRGVRYNWDQLRRLGMTNAQFLLYAEDPRIYDSTLVTYTVPYGGTTTPTGIGFNLGFPFGFGTAILPNGITINNSGSRSSPAIMTITGPITDPHIINDTLGLTMSFSTILTGADTLVIDTTNRTVTQNGVTNRRGTLVAPNWFDISPGNSFIRFGGTTGTGSQLDIEFRPAYY